MVATRRVSADEYVENGTLVLGADADLGLEVLRALRVFG
jgi:hypothetical protein